MLSKGRRPTAIQHGAAAWLPVRPVALAGRFVAARLAVVAACRRSGGLSLEEFRTDDEFPGCASAHDPLPDGDRRRARDDRSGRRTDRQWHGGADVAGAGQFQPAALAADTHAEPDAGSGHRAVADPHGIPAGDAVTARDPACHTDADVARDSDPDTAGDRIANAGRHADCDSGADPDADGDLHSIAHAGRGRYAVARSHDRTGDRTG